MNLLKTLLAAAAMATIVLTFRDWERGEWLFPGGPEEMDEDEETEPVLGYDGMDRDTLITWLREARLDNDVLERVQRYERRNERRAVVLETVEELLG